MKKYVLGLLVALAVATGGYFGKQYFDANFVILNLEEQEGIAFAFQMAQMSAYMKGAETCKNSL